ncbi:uncharacterized protein LOC127278040 [Leptopilina boulardi]|uniref:uncharacterized protein LOC127278040 n=1 Tax=Leptopilina boulardi TaxID=63433 RepID=UPI0021F53725|nr:uncharacterized protein LOC127278040 [Leptopilina boulardi]
MFKNNQWTCKYPEEEDYPNVDKWIRQEITPVSTWKNFNINLIADARNYEQAYRRMERMCSEGTVNNSGVDTDTKNSDVNSPEKLRMLTLKDAAGVLKNIPQMNLEKDNDAGLNKLDFSGESSSSFSTNGRTKITSKEPRIVQNRKSKFYSCSWH